MKRRAALESEAQIVVVEPVEGDGHVPHAHDVVAEHHAELVMDSEVASGGEATSEGPPDTGIQLVLTEDKVKQVRFKGDPRPAPVLHREPEPTPPAPTLPAPTVQGGNVGEEVDLLGRPSASFSGAPRGANLRPWQRTVYRSSRGTEVRRFESSYGTSTLTTTRGDGPIYREERFHGRLVDDIVGSSPSQVEAPPTEVPDEPAPAPQPEKPVKAKKTKLWFLRGKKKPGEDSGAAFIPALPEDRPAPAEPVSSGWEPSDVPEATVVEATPTKPAKKPSGSNYYDYAGDDHEVIDLEGVGPEYAKRLQKEGVWTTSRLCYEDAEDLAARIDVPEKTVRTWQAMAELVKVKGIGPQFAEAMARAGITGIQELKDRRSASIAEQVQRYLDSLDANVIGTSVTAKRVGTWKKSAARMRKVRLPIPATTQPEKEVVRGHIKVLKTRRTKPLGPPKA